MIPLPIDKPDVRLSAPKDWDHEKQGICHTLEAMIVDGAFVSVWQPSEIELKRLNEGKPIFLSIRSNKHPVVSLYVPEIKEDSKLVG